MANVLKNVATVGFEEKNDMLVTVSPGDVGSGIKIELTSPVMKQYGKHITDIIKKCVQAADIDDAVLIVKDKGAWDYTITARVQAALARGLK